MPGAKACRQDIVDKAIRAHFAKRGVERELINHVNAKLGEQARPRGRQGEMEGRIIGAEQLARMWLEGQHRKPGSGQGGTGGSDQMGMATMDTVEIAECHGRATRVRRQIVPGRQNLHRAQFPP